MSESLSDFWEGWKDSAREEKEITRQINLETINRVCERDGISIKVISETHYRLSKSTIMPVDVYPQSGKVCVFGTNRFNKPENLAEYLTKYFDRKETISY